MNSKNQFTPHFTLLEFTESATARKCGIANEPPDEAVANLRSLCIHALEPLREALGQPVVITSGFRCKALNRLIAHHSGKSQHMEGRAADFYVGWNGPEVDKPSHRERLIKAFRLIIADDSIDYDQVILYPSFIHVSFVSRDKNRRRITTANGHGTYCAVTRAEALAIV